MISLFIYLLMASLSALFIYLLVRPPVNVIQPQYVKKKYTLKLVKHTERRYYKTKLPIQLHHKQVI